MCFENIFKHFFENRNIITIVDESTTKIITKSNEKNSLFDEMNVKEIANENIENLCAIMNVSLFKKHFYHN